MLKRRSDRTISYEYFACVAPVVSGLQGGERAPGIRIVTQNSHKRRRGDVRSFRNATKYIHIDKTQTSNDAILTLAKTLDVPKAHWDEFARAVATIAKDTQLPTPRLLPIVLGKAPSETPGTVVSEAAAWLDLDFPKVAPEKWPLRGKGYRYQAGDETPEDFAVRVYGKWMHPGEPQRSIGMPEILHLDQPLWNALRRSTRIEKPEGYCLPSKKERNDAQIVQFQSGHMGPVAAKEWLRLSSAAMRRR